MSRMRLTAVLALMILALSCRPGAAAPTLLTVGVVDFYTPTPLGLFIILPERFAADDLSIRLARAADGRFTVVPRGTMEQAQASLRWQNSDVLHFDRLRELARATGADRLVVGWIPLFTIQHGGGFFLRPRNSEPGNALVNLVIQVFDAGQGRLVAERRFSASVIGSPQRDLLAEQALQQALSSAIPSLVGLLIAQTP